MRAMILDAPGRPLRAAEVPAPRPQTGQVLVRVSACGVCRTDLHVVDGDLTEPTLPIIPGHQIVGRVEQVADGVDGFAAGARVGVPWLGWTCGACAFCTSDRENLCDEARFTGYQINGGFAEYTVADARYCFPLPEGYPDDQVAPLLCAGLIGYRSLRMSGEAKRLGLYGFGAAAHIVIQVARHQDREVYVFVRRGDKASARFAEQLGATWTGWSDEPGPRLLDAAIIFAPVGPLVPAALRAVAKGGCVICAGIHMSDIPSFPYDILWGERSVRSVANLTRADGNAFLQLASEIGIETRVHAYPLERAGDALATLRAGEIEGAAVVVP